MGNAYNPGLQGFDSFEVKLGDQLRGERASKGKTLLDVQRELRLRAELIDAIENADASVFNAPGFASGYIRSYARYLNLDPDDVYQRFCAESGFRAITEVSIEPKLNQGGGKPVNPGRDVDDLVIDNRFVSSNARDARMDLGATMRGLASVAALAALVIGLGFGSWTMLQNLQRVGFAPLPDAPDVLVSAPDIQAPAPYSGDTDDLAAAASVSETRISLSELYAEQEFAPPVVEARDGPISSIDPMHAGVYAADEFTTSLPPTIAPQNAPEVIAAAPVVALDDLFGDASGVTEERLTVGALDHLVSDTMIDNQASGLLSDGLDAVVINIVAVEDAWLRVRDGEAKTLFTGILGAGDRFVLPPEAEAPVLRAGNAGAVYLVVGDAAFGPLGAGPVVAKNVKLTPEAIREAYPLAEDVAFEAVVDARRAGLRSRSAIAQLPQD